MLSLLALKAKMKEQKAPTLGIYSNFFYRKRSAETPVFPNDSFPEDDDSPTKLTNMTFNELVNAICYGFEDEIILEHDYHGITVGQSWVINGTTKGSDRPSFNLSIYMVGNRNTIYVEFTVKEKRGNFLCKTSFSENVTIADINSRMTLFNNWYRS